MKANLECSECSIKPSMTVFLSYFCTTKSSMSFGTMSFGRIDVHGQLEEIKKCNPAPGILTGQPVVP